MCLIALAWRAVPGYALIVAANRDEYHARPTAPAAFWHDVPDLYAGRDLQDGGTWMGVHRSGRFAALTNHRNPALVRGAPRSRGHLVAGFLDADLAPRDYAVRVGGERGQYNGFNLLTGDLHALWYAASHDEPPTAVDAGFHALSNARLDTPWPKATGLVHDLESAVRDRPGEEALVTRLLDALADREPPPDDRLPDTGIGIERERKLGSRRIVDPVYGTRSSAVLLLRGDGSMRYDEVSFDAGGQPTGRVTQAITPSAAAPA
jgi:uncharacterized protein with NRDE domain